jgi:hypothetical protein
MIVVSDELRTKRGNESGPGKGWPGPLTKPEQHPPSRTARLKLVI